MMNVFSSAVRLSSSMSDVKEMPANHQMKVNPSHGAFFENKQDVQQLQVEPYWFSFYVLYHCTHVYIYIYIYLNANIHIRVCAFVCLSYMLRYEYVCKFKTCLAPHDCILCLVSISSAWISGEHIHNVGYPMIFKQNFPNILNIHTYYGIKHPKHRCNLKERSTVRRLHAQGQGNLSVQNVPTTGKRWTWKRITTERGSPCMHIYIYKMCMYIWNKSESLKTVAWYV